MRKVILVFAGFLVICFNLYSQVHIKEKVEVKPFANKSLSSTSFATSGTFQIILSGGPSSANIGSEHYSGEAGLNITVPNVRGYYSYHVSSAIMVDGVKRPGAYSIKAYFAGYVILDQSGIAYDAFGDGYALCDDPTLTFFRNFEFYGPGGGNVTTDHNRCEGGDIWTGGNISESIGSSNGAYVNWATMEQLGNSISYPYEGDYTYTIISKLPFDAQPEQTTITGSLGGMSNSVPFELLPQSKFSIRDEILSYQETVGFELEP